MLCFSIFISWAVLSHQKLKLHFHSCLLGGLMAIFASVYLHGVWKRCLYMYALAEVRV